MRSDLTDVTMVLDRSGSMQNCRSDAQGGVNAFIDDQKKEPGECRLTLVEFDDRYEVVHDGVPIQDVPEYTLVPRGSTALLDAIGRAINTTGERLAKMPEEERPALVMFVILTDGLENCSREFTRDAINQLITQQQNDYQWKFSYLGANQDAFAEASQLGIAPDAVANYDTVRTTSAMDGISKLASRSRGQAMRGEAVAYALTSEERDAMTSDKQT